MDGRPESVSGFAPHTPFLEAVPRPALVRLRNSNTAIPFLQRPLLAPLLFPNESSDARDHAANERTFLSWLRLAVYLAVVAVAIVISFHLKSEPSELEMRLSLPLGIIFWLLSLACMASGLANYIGTVTQYSRRAALVQSGWKTQLVFTVVATAIVASCIIFLAVDAQTREEDIGDSLHTLGDHLLGRGLRQSASEVQG